MTGHPLTNANWWSHMLHDRHRGKQGRVISSEIWKKGYVKKVDDEDKWKQTLFRITKTIFLTCKILENSDVSYYCNNIIYFLQTRCGWRKDLNKDLKKIH